MLDAHRVEAIRQAKTNALCGKVMNTTALHGLRWKSQLVDYLGYAVPIGLLVATVVVLRLQVPELTFLIVADILGGILLIGTLVKASYGWQDKLNRHTKLLSDNMDLVREGDSLLARQKTASAEAADAFIAKAAEIEKQDIDIFGKLKEPKRQETYRMALREFGLEAKCQCGASPWQFLPGACQICGGTPKPATP